MGTGYIENLVHDMKEGLDKQVSFVDEVKTKLDRATYDLKNTNARLKETIMKNTQTNCSKRIFQHSISHLIVNISWLWFVFYIIHVCFSYTFEKLELVSSTNTILGLLHYYHNNIQDPSITFLILFASHPDHVLSCPFPFLVLSLYYLQVRFIMLCTHVNH